MPFRKRGITMFHDWEPGDAFDAETDRLIVTTSWGDKFIAGPGPNGDDSTSLVVDRQFMPDNLADIPRQLKIYHRLPLDWDATAYPWEIFLYDEGMTPNGSAISMEAVGVGWTRPIRTQLTVEAIEPITIGDIDPKVLARDLDGVHFGEFNVREEIMYEEAFRS